MLNLEDAALSFSTRRFGFLDKSVLFLLEDFNAFLFLGRNEEDCWTRRVGAQVIWRFTILTMYRSLIQQMQHNIEHTSVFDPTGAACFLRILRILRFTWSGVSTAVIHADAFWTWFLVYMMLLKSICLMLFGSRRF